MNQESDPAFVASPSESDAHESAAPVSQHNRKQKQQHTNTNYKNGPVVPPRPSNSYLKVIMDDSVLKTLHALTQQIISCWENENMERRNTSDVAFQLVTEEQPTTDTQSTTEPQERHKLKIKPRSLQSLHMTYFFMGTILDEMKPQEVTLWNSMLQQKLCTDREGKRYALKFKGFETFPPHRRNLIVATFESSEHLDELYEELCDLAMTPKEESDSVNIDNDEEQKHSFCVDKEYEFPLLRSAIKKEVKKRKQQKMKHQHSSPWVAHVTLANIVGGRNLGIKQLSEWLSDQQFSTQFDDLTASTAEAIEENAVGVLDHGIVVQGLKLGGPHPQNVDLDWSFPFNRK